MGGTNRGTVLQLSGLDFHLGMWDSLEKSLKQRFIYVF